MWNGEPLSRRARLGLFDHRCSDLRTEFDHVFVNPPFHPQEGQVSPIAARARAKHDESGLAPWIEAGLRRVRSRGTLTVIFRADRLHDVISVVPDKGLTLFPFWPRRAEPAKRALVQIRKSSMAAAIVLPGLVLHKADGSYTRQADAVLRGEAAIDLTSKDQA
jgi:tRNA1(Val) A37 N6-methylase TrmN6